MEESVCRLALGDWQSIYTLVYYSHLIPVIIALVLSAFALFKSNFSFLSKIYSLFTLGFCIWLAGDTIVWTSTNFNLISFVWAPLDYINILFFLFGTYFFAVLVKGKDLSCWPKLLLCAIAFPAWWITITYQSISAFNQPMCEAFNSEFLTQYKFVVEVLAMAFIMFYALFKACKASMEQRWQVVSVATALILFFSTFAVTEYIASQTGIYEINLYSLFILPVFLFIIIYSITNLGIFRIRLIGFQLLAYLLIVMVGSQFFFLQSTTNKALTVITFFLSLGFGMLLVRSGKREQEARKKVEKLAAELEMANNQLKELDRQKDLLISIVSHQLNTPVTSVKWNIEMMLDGDMGEVSDEQKKQLQTIQTVTTDLADLVSMLLDVSRIQLGRMKVDRMDLKLDEFFNEILTVIEPKAQQKKQKFVKNIPGKLPAAMLDKRLMRMTLENLLTNAVKYTPDGGEVIFAVTVEGDKLRYSVKDTGYGIPKADQEKIFGQLFRASNVQKVDGNGLGLFAAKGAVEAQEGTIRFESEEGKGTTFFVELPIIAPEEKS